jgi:hypothetical protein
LLGNCCWLMERGKRFCFPLEIKMGRHSPGIVQEAREVRAKLPPSVCVTVRALPLSLEKAC